MDVWAEAAGHEILIRYPERMDGKLVAGFGIAAGDVRRVSVELAVDKYTCGQDVVATFGGSGVCT